MLGADRKFCLHSAPRARIGRIMFGRTSLSVFLDLTAFAHRVFGVLLYVLVQCLAEAPHTLASLSFSLSFSLSPLSSSSLPLTCKKAYYTIRTYTARPRRRRQLTQEQQQQQRQDQQENCVQQDTLMPSLCTFMGRLMSRFRLKVAFWGNRVAKFMQKLIPS